MIREIAKKNATDYAYDAEAKHSASSRCDISFSLLRVLAISFNNLTRKKNRPWIVVAIVAIVLSAMIFVFWFGNGSHSHRRHEFFVELDYEAAVHTSFQLPFAIKLSGESNKLDIELDTIERVFPYNGRVSVVLHGSATLTDATTGVIRENSEAALRFSVGFVVKEGAVLTFDGAELDSLKVYSDNPDVEAIVQRKTAECWRHFVSSRRQWTMDINGLSFKPEKDVQLEDNGVFVFGEETRR